MTTKQPTMTPKQYRLAIKALGLSQVRAGRLFGISPRQAQRIARGETKVPRYAILALELLPILGEDRRHALFERYSANIKS